MAKYTLKTYAHLINAVIDEIHLKGDLFDKYFKEYWNRVNPGIKETKDADKLKFILQAHLASLSWEKIMSYVYGDCIELSLGIQKKIKLIGKNEKVLKIITPDNLSRNELLNLFPEIARNYIEYYTQHIFSSQSWFPNSIFFYLQMK